MLGPFFGLAIFLDVKADPRIGPTAPGWDWANDSTSLAYGKGKRAPSVHDGAFYGDSTASTASSAIMQSFHLITSLIQCATKERNRLRQHP